MIFVNKSLPQPHLRENFFCFVCLCRGRRRHHLEDLLLVVIVFLLLKKKIFFCWWWKWRKHCRSGCLVTYAADGDGVYTAASGHGPAGDAVHGLAIQEGKDLPASAILATGKRDATNDNKRSRRGAPYCL